MKVMLKWMNWSDDIMLHRISANFTYLWGKSCNNSFYLLPPLPAHHSACRHHYLPSSWGRCSEDEEAVTTNKEVYPARYWKVLVTEWNEWGNKQLQDVYIKTIVITATLDAKLKIVFCLLRLSFWIKFDDLLSTSWDCLVPMSLICKSRYCGASHFPHFYLYVSIILHVI